MNLNARRPVGGKEVIVFSPDNFGQFCDEPIVLEKYKARETDKGYAAESMLEGDRAQTWMPVFAKEDNDRYGSYRHAYKDPLNALAHAERSVVKDLEQHEQKVSDLKEKLAQIEKLRRKHARIKI